MPPKKKSHYALHFYFIFALVTIFSNASVIFFQVFMTNVVLLPDESARFLEIFLQSSNWYYSGWLSYAFPFFIVMPISISYILPVGKYLSVYGKGKDEFPTEKVMRRALSLPSFIASISLLGWLIALSMATYFLLISWNGVSLSLVLRSAYLYLAQGLLVFVFNYYLFDIMGRRKLIPIVFREARISDVKRVRNFSLKARFLILWMAITILPVSIFLLIINALSGYVPEVAKLFYGKSFGMAVFFLIATFLITTFIARAISRPLSEMDQAAKRIQEGDFEISVTVLSADELGRLCESLNTTAKSLGEKELIKDTFGRMVDPNVRDYLLAGNLKLGGESKTATVLFADIRDFTTMSEAMNPVELVTLLNRYFSAMTFAIESEGGMVNKFIGDAVMALFGVPVSQADHADAAIRASVKMQVALAELNRELKSERKGEIRIGIGIHSGELVAGNIGSGSRMEYTVIGDTVNVASRIEGLCKKTGESLLISKDTVQLLSSREDLETLGNFEVKGRVEPVQVFRKIPG